MSAYYPMLLIPKPFGRGYGIRYSSIISTKPGLINKKNNRNEPFGFTMAKFHDHRIC
jgi:hypothetical protein